jgi:hypothetical protein
MAEKQAKKARTIYFTDSILEAIEIAMDKSKTGEKKNQVILNCIVEGLKRIYNVEV